MGLINCKECKKEISSKATACPHWGAPVSKENRNLRCGTILGTFLLLGLAGSFITQCSADKEREAQEAQAREQARVAAQARASAIESFRSNPNATLEKARQLIEQQRWAQIVSLLEPLLPANNEDAQRLHDQALEKKLLTEVAAIPASNFQANYDHYDRLARLQPANSVYSQKRDRYKARWDEQQRKEAAERLVFGETPQKSAWDGSYPEVKAYLKRTAHDPDSIEFVGCSEVFKNKDGWLIGCQYRGKNAFGGRILTVNWFRIQRGSVVEVYDEDAFKW